MPFLSFSYRGFRFVFKQEPGEEPMLHIFARHLKHPQDAMRVWLTGETLWNDERSRFETSTETETLYWFWLEEGKTVMVVSCFDRKEGER